MILFLLIFVLSFLVFLFKKFKHSKKLIVTENHVVFITGCDSGLGHFAALSCYDLGFTVIATVLNENSDGSKRLKEYINENNSRFHLIEMDLMNDTSIKDAVDYVSELIHQSKGFKKLHAIINNAGVMVFGEFEWLTNDIIQEQVRVNFIGPMLLTKHLLPIIRTQKSRIINITSHCSLKSLPGLSVYSGTKAAFRFWTEALEKELYKFGVKVINFIPGSFVMSSNITSRTIELSKRMKKVMSEEQINIYEEYFDRYYGYLSHISSYKSPSTVEFDSNIITKLMDALLDEFPRCVYKEEPWRYKFYYNLFKFIPQGVLEHWLVEKFMMMPKYEE